MCQQYQPTQLYLRVSFSLPAQVSFFLICTGDSTGAGYGSRIMPRPDVNYLWSEMIDYHHCCFMNLGLNSFPYCSLICIRTSFGLSLPSYFIISENVFRCHYLGASYFGRPPVSKKQFVQDTALVAIESWPEWDLNPQPLNSIQML